MNGFVNYVHSFYGKGGIYELRNAEGQVLTKRTIREALPTMHTLMMLVYAECGLDSEFVGDSIDREFMRDEVLEEMGYFEGVMQ